MTTKIKVTKFAHVAIPLLLITITFHDTPAEQPAPKAFVDGNGPGWVSLGQDEFVNVNCADDTWTWTDSSVHCSGVPTGVIRTKKKFQNFELVLQWRHLRSAGNSGVFAWVSDQSLKGLQPGGLPAGIEVQILDHGYAMNYERRHGKKGDWFSTNGDVFAVNAKMKPFPPTSPDGSRSFPSKNLSNGFGQWNHYYIRAINGEVRLWVNGEEVSGGSGCEPRQGYLALESEGSPIDFKQIRLRELP